MGLHQEKRRTPNGIRTRAATLKGWADSVGKLLKVLINNIFSPLE
jgi:hypothetical protein